MIKQKIWNNNNKDKLREYQKTFRTKNNLSKGIYVDLNDIEIDDENIKLDFEDIFDTPEFIESQKYLLETSVDDKVNNIL